MVRTIYIPVDFEYNGKQISTDIPFQLHEDINDIIEYLFEQKYGVKYGLGWYLEDGAKKFVKEIEEKWFYNKFDSFTLYTKDYNFIDWLKDKYQEEATEQHTQELDDTSFDSYLENEEDIVDEYGYMTLDDLYEEAD